MKLLVIKRKMVGLKLIGKSQSKSAQAEGQGHIKEGSRGGDKVPKLEENDEEVLETLFRHRLNEEEYSDLKKNYPEQIKKFERNFWVAKDGSGKYTVSGRGADVFRQHIRYGSYQVMPLGSYKRVYKPDKIYTKPVKVSASRRARSYHRSKPRR